MQRRSFIQSIVALLGSRAVAQALERDVSFREIPSLQPRDPSGRRLVAYGDCCSGIPGGGLERNLASVNAVVAAIDPQPEFIAFLGDAISGYVSDYDQLRKQWEYWLETEMKWVSDRRIPLYQSTSNHNTYDADSEEVFRDVHPHLPQNGPDGQKGLAYWFRDGNLLYISTHQPHGKMPIDYDWLDRTLAENADADFKFVAGHYPVFPVNGYSAYVGWPIWCFPPDERRPFWDILAKHRVTAYLASHVIAFDVQVHDGVLQIVTGGAGTSWGPGGFMPGGTEYFHAVQIAVDEQGLRYQVHDVDGVVREELSWPPRNARDEEWSPLDNELADAELQSVDLQREFLVFRFRGVAGDSHPDAADQTLVCGADANEGVDPLWIGLDGDSGRLKVHLVPVSGDGWQVWEGPLLKPGTPFDFQVALHPGMGPGGVLYREHPSSQWSTLSSTSSRGSQGLRPVNWFVGEGFSGPTDRPFAGLLESVDYWRCPLVALAEKTRTQ